MTTKAMNIDKYRVAANISEYHVISKLLDVKIQVKMSKINM